MNKLLTVGATTLFICLAFTPGITADETNFGNILYVGGTGPGNYSRIQDSIDNASEGDMVFVVIFLIIGVSFLPNYCSVSNVG